MDSDGFSDFKTSSIGPGKDKIPERTTRNSR